jgi:hypothetical protein
MMTKTQECWWNSQSPRQLFHNPQSKKVLLRESLKKQPYLLLQPRSRATWTQSESQREQKPQSFLLRPSHRELHLQSKTKISVSHQFAHQWPLRLPSQSSQRWILLQELQRSQAVARLTLQFRTSRLFSIKTLKRDKMWFSWNLCWTVNFKLCREIWNLCNQTTVKLKLKLFSDFSWFKSSVTTLKLAFPRPRLRTPSWSRISQSKSNSTRR